MSMVMTNGWNYLVSCSSQVNFLSVICELRHQYCPLSCPLRHTLTFWVYRYLNGPLLQCYWNIVPGISLVPLTNHYPKKYWSSYLTPFDVTRGQWIELNLYLPFEGGEYGLVSRGSFYRHRLILIPAMIIITTWYKIPTRMVSKLKCFLGPLFSNMD